MEQKCDRLPEAVRNLRIDNKIKEENNPNKTLIIELDAMVQFYAYLISGGSIIPQSLSSN